LTDEGIVGVDAHLQNWISQQIVKMKFYKVGVADFYLVIDSDSYFIRDFYKSDFMYNESIPYIIMHENKYFMELASCLGDKNIFDKVKNIKDYLKRDGKVYSFYSNPVFSSKVLEELEKNVDAIENLIAKYPLEYVWHGEYLLKSKCIDFMPCESFFKVFNYEAEYKLWRSQGENLSDIKKYYIGILVQDRWCKRSKFKNSLRAKFNRRINRVIFFINRDRAHLKKNFRYYRHFVRDFFKVLFKGEC
jgi:hypothetical protein